MSTEATTRRDESPLYFQDVVDEWQHLGEEQKKLQRRQEALAQLDERVSKIDCDLGGATVEITDGGIVTVSTSTPDMCEEVKSLIRDYSWPKKSAIGYDTRSECVTWTLKTDIETLFNDHQQMHAGN